MKRKKVKYESIFIRESRFYEPVYTPAVVANKLHLSTHTLRLYEAEGLIIPCRTNTGRRLYSDVELEKIKIKVAEANNAILKTLDQDFTIQGESDGKGSHN